jgi:hypothetical protein
MRLWHLLFHNFWTNETKVIEFRVILVSKKLIFWIFKINLVKFLKKLEVKTTLTKIVLGWVTLQEVLVQTGQHHRAQYEHLIIIGGQ